MEAWRLCFGLVGVILSLKLSKKKPKTLTEATADVLVFMRP